MQTINLIPNTSVEDMLSTILQKTHDGDDLAPKHLKLVEIVANGYANEAGMTELKRIYEAVINNKYTPPWFHGIENLTINHEGFVLYKGEEVEHYSGSAISDPEDAIKLAARCRWLESQNIKVKTLNTIWRWDEHIGPDKPE